VEPIDIHFNRAGDHEKIGPKVILVAVTRTTSLILVLSLSVTAPAQSSTAKSQASPSPDKSSSKQPDQSTDETRDPIERSDELKSKLTLGIYFTPGDRVYDLNLRHQCGPLTAWIAGFYDPKGNKLLRVGAQYDYKKGWLHLVPSIEVETTKGLSGSLYSELGILDALLISDCGYCRCGIALDCVAFD
jgi:hypothetical protein